jgi:uncharacterized protein YkwD
VIRFGRRASVVFLSIAAGGVLFGSAALAASPDRTSAETVQRAQADLVAATNAAREAAGCSPVEADAELHSTAQRHAEEMAERGYLEHTGRDGATPSERIGAHGYADAYGENLAHGYPTVLEVMEVWMNSPEHRTNIEDCSFTSIGVGYDGAGHYWVQDFGA